ncbi:MAG: sensor histidine kinase [Campylobacterota bacterium]|nr:sensor histidine kinase [Campylobacterota bacterium]
MKFKSLKSNIILYLILLSIIPLVIGSSVVLYQMYKSKEESLYNKHQQILNQVIYESDNIVKDIEHAGQYVIDKYPVKKHTLLTGLTQVQKNIKTILILNHEGILKDFGSSLKTNIYKGYDYSNMKYFQAIKKGDQNHWTEVFLSNATQLPSIAYSVRIDNQTIAVLIVDLSTLNDYAKKFKSLDNSTMVRIMDRNGIFIAHPEKPESVSQRKTINGSDIYNRFISNSLDNKQIIFYATKQLKNIGIYGTTDKLKWIVIVKERYDFIFDSFNMLILFIILFIFSLIVVSIYFSLKLSKSIVKPLNYLNQKMDDIAHGKEIKEIENTNYSELDILASNFLIMQEKIKNREELNREKDKQIYDSAKMAQMGEMIGNIAHQWRQPLSVISTAASGMKIEKEFDILDDDKFNNYCDSIDKNTQYLSDTIDTFRDFIKEKKELKEVILQDRIDGALNIISSSLNNHFIKLVNEIDYENKIKVTLVLGELSQVIINIINNAKDVLVENKIDEPYIKINCTSKGNMAIITIVDNGGGIPSNILPKIFDPYFTTKHQTQGTGLGLHMSYKIITESLKGKLYAKNTDIGAMFVIEIPIKDD